MNASSASVTARARLLLVAAATLAAAVVAVVLGLSRWMIGTPSLPAAAAMVVGVVALGPAAALLPAARRTSGTILVATAWTAGVAVAALLGLASLLLALGRLPDRREQVIIAAAAAGLVIAATVAGPLPARAVAAARRLAGRSDRLPEDLLAYFADRSAGGAPLVDLLRELAETLRRAWRLSAVEVWTGGGDALALTTAVPAREVPVTILDVEDLSRLRRVGVAGPGWLRTWIPALLPGRGGRDHGQLRLAPAVHGETVLALLVVERPEDADRFGEDNERALAEVAQRLAVVLRNRDLDAQLQDTLTDLRRTNAELRASRARLVAAADAERRRIERDLHDGAQQHLVALGVGLGLLRDTLPAAQADAAWPGLLDQLERQVDRASADLRDLAHGIYPSLLRDAGLKAALPAAARRSALPVTVTVTDLERYPPQVEAAIYFCCLEALQNVAKHAKGATVRLRAWAGSGQVHLEISDDGPGFDPDRTPPGAGLQNMADRLGAVGGSMSCRSAPGEGTTVHAHVPIDPAA
jgi:signal transduction histidine kinase